MSSHLFVPDWYGRLDLSTPPPKSKPTPAEHQWMIYHEDWFDQEKMAADPDLAKEVMAFRDEVADKFTDAVLLDFLPLIFVRGSRADIESLARIPRFQRALSVPVAITDYLPILKGISALRSETGNQLFQWQEFVDSGGTLPDSRFVGGMLPSAAYPATLDPTHIVADPGAHRWAPPAWMPVINLSVGPFIEDLPANPIMISLIAAGNTHLVVVAAGNAGGSPDRSTVNTWAPYGSALIVGATEDEGGSKLAAYSSRGIPTDQSNRPDIVAWGHDSLSDDCGPNNEHCGTSFAAPRVAKIGCLAAAVISQVTRVYDEVKGRSNGVPLVGWGLIDVGNATAGLPPRSGSEVLPLCGVKEQVLIDAFAGAAKSNGRFHFTLNGRILREMILRAARPMPQYSAHEVGAGFISETLFIDWLSKMTLSEFLAPFGDTSKIPRELSSEKLFHRNALEHLADAVRESRPAWYYDFENQIFGVNMATGKGKKIIPPIGRYRHIMKVMTVRPAGSQ